MQFRVVIPEHVKAGQTIRIHCPDGTEANVKVPKGMKTGDSFIFEMAVDQLNNPEALLETIRKESNAKTGFLDREIVNAQDFMLALIVGLIIGMGIVFGFLMGVLYATHGVTEVDMQTQTTTASPTSSSSSGVADAAPIILTRTYRHYQQHQHQGRKMELPWRGVLEE